MNFLKAEDIPDIPTYNDWSVATEIELSNKKKIQVQEGKIEQEGNCNDFCTFF